MAKGAKMISRGEQVFDEKAERIVSKLYGLTSEGQFGVVATTVISIEDFEFWYGLQTETMKAIQRYKAEKHIKGLPKGRRRKASSNVVPMRAVK